MKISVGCDHIVTDIKNHVVKYLESKGHEVIDNGTYDNERTHYPIFGVRTAEKVINQVADFGIVICGTGVGITSSASKVKGIRATLVRDLETARYARRELNANVLGLGGRICGLGLIENIIDVFLDTEYVKTEANTELINRIDQLIENDEQVHDKSLFDEFLKKWNNGEYPSN